MTGALCDSAFARLASRAARSPTRRASRALERPTAKPATITAKTTRPIDRDELERPVASALRGEAGDGEDREAEDHELVPDALHDDGEPDRAALKPHARSIANDVAIPTAAPPGATDDSAVDASVTRVALK